VYGELTVELESYRVRYRGRIVHLGPTPYRLLCFFMRHPGTVFDRRELIAAVWPDNAHPRPVTVDMHILRLRAALTSEGAPDPIEGVRGVGYALRQISH